MQVSHIHHAAIFSFSAEETTFEAGVKVQIHTQSEPPFIQELGFGVAPGFQTFVATQEQRVSGVYFSKVACQEQNSSKRCCTLIC